MVFLQVCLCIVCAWYLQRPKEVVESLNLELKIVVSYHVGAGNQIWSPGRAKSAPNH